MHTRGARRQAWERSQQTNLMEVLNGDDDRRAKCSVSANGQLTAINGAQRGMEDIVRDVRMCGGLRTRLRCCGQAQVLGERDCGTDGRVWAG